MRSLDLDLQWFRRTGSKRREVIVEIKPCCQRTVPGVVWDRLFHRTRVGPVDDPVDQDRSCGPLKPSLPELCPCGQAKFLRLLGRYCSAGGWPASQVAAHAVVGRRQRVRRLRGSSVRLVARLSWNSGSFGNKTVCGVRRRLAVLMMMAAHAWK
ncbi:hypothetical protein Droror1_Dr00019571 [Drosera rotundifolia]